MNIEQHIHTAKNRLDLVRGCVEQRKYDTALAMLTNAFTNIRELIDHIFTLKREEEVAEHPAGEDGT